MKRAAKKKARLLVMPSPKQECQSPDWNRSADTYLENIVQIQEQTNTLCNMLDNGDLEPEKAAEVSRGFLHLGQIALCGIMARMQAVDSVQAREQR